MSTAERTEHTRRIVAFDERGRVLAVAHPTDVEGQWIVVPPGAGEEARDPLARLGRTKDGPASPVAVIMAGVVKHTGPSPEAALAWLGDRIEERR